MQGVPCPRVTLLQIWERSVVAKRREQAKTSQSERPRRRHLDDVSFARLPPVVNTVVKRTRVPAGSLVKMATDADIDSGRKRTLIQSVEAYTWNVLFGKIHGGIRNIQCKSRLRGTFHRCTIVPRNFFFDEGASCLCFVGVEGTCIFSRGYLACLRGYPRCTRVPDLFLILLPRVSPNFGGANEATNLWTRILLWKIMFHVRAIALYPFNTVWNSRYILKYDDKNVRKVLKHLHFNHKGTYIASECVACYPVF